MVQVKFDSESIHIQADQSKGFVKYKPSMVTLTKTMKIPEPHVMAGMESGKTLMAIAKEWVKAHPDQFQDGLKAIQGGLPAGFKILQPAELAALPAEKQIEYYKAYNEYLLQAKTFQGRLTVRVSKSGGISVYGMGKFPVTLYAEQWEKIFTTAKPEIDAIIAEGYEKTYTGKDSQTGEAWSTTLKRKGE